MERKPDELPESFWKSSLYATIVGIMAAVSIFLFLRTLDFASKFISANFELFWLLPFGGLIAGLVAYYVSRRSLGEGTKTAIYAWSKERGRLNFFDAIGKFLASIATIATGGSAGPEGAGVLISASLAGAISPLLKLSRYQRKRLVVCGISAGFAAVFGAPIAGAIFGVEAILLDSIMYDLIYPSFVASVVSYLLSVWLKTPFFQLVAPVHIDISLPLLVLVALSGLLFGGMGWLFKKSMEISRAVFSSLRIWPPLVPAIGGLCIAALALIFGTAYLGSGDQSTFRILLEHTINPGAPFLKLAFTALTLGSGGSGGVIMPLFFVGASLGHIFAAFIGSNTALFAAIGMIAVLGISTNTPVASSVLAVEFFGPTIGALAALACVTGYLLIGNQSLFIEGIGKLGKGS